jgi:hypothetical protein
MPALSELVHTSNTTDMHPAAYIDEEEEEVFFEPGIEGLECPQYCGARLRRVPDVMRHMREQHLCAHPNCKDKSFRTKFVRDKHEEESHPNEVLRFQCGSCGLRGSPKRFVRVDKLRSHFKSIHRVQGSLCLKDFNVKNSHVFLSPMEEECSLPPEITLISMLNQSMELRLQLMYATTGTLVSKPSRPNTTIY